MIKMFCDQCGERIPDDTNGGVRLRTGKREFSIHLCAQHQEELRRYVSDLCRHVREVQPSLRREG